jgi:calcium permeable stress-gated cation channel
MPQGRTFPSSEMSEISFCEGESSFLISHREKTPPLPGGFLNWVADFYRISDIELLKKQSLDSYLFLRFLRMMATITFVGCCITWPILFPVNASGGGGQSQLDVVSFSNVADPNRYYAHVLVAFIFLGMCLQYKWVN